MIKNEARHVSPIIEIKTGSILDNSNIYKTLNYFDRINEKNIYY